MAGDRHTTGWTDLLFGAEGGGHQLCEQFRGPKRLPRLLLCVAWHAFFSMKCTHVLIDDARGRGWHATPRQGGRFVIGLKVGMPARGGGQIGMALRSQHDAKAQTRMIMRVRVHTP